MYDTLLLILCKTGLSEQMRKRLCEVICVAPWTSLNLGGEFAIGSEWLVKREWNELHLCVNRDVVRRNSCKNDM